MNQSSAALLDNLLQLYLHDLSEFSAQRLDVHGRYHYPYLDHYWREPDRQVFLFEDETDAENKEILGFAMVRQDMNPNDGEMFWQLAEFFILRLYRQSGVGSRAINLLWDQLPGAWQLSVINNNLQAKRFWPKVISARAGEALPETSLAKITSYQFNIESR